MAFPAAYEQSYEIQKFQTRKRGYLFGYLDMTWLIPRVLSYSAFLLAPFFSSGGSAGENPGDEVARQAFEREWGKSEYSSVRERNRRARCPASRCHPVYELNTLPACRRLHAGNSTLGLRLAVGQMVNWFIIAPHQNS